MLNSISSKLATLSILLDCPIDTADEEIGGIKPNGSRQEPEACNHGDGVAKIEKGRNKIHYVELQEREVKWEVKG